MKTTFFLITILFARIYDAKAQTREIDSLKLALQTEKNDTARIKAMYYLSNDYQEYKPDSALLIAQQALLMAKNIHFLKGESGSLNSMAGALGRLGNYSKALEYSFEQLKLQEKINDPRELAVININLANFYNDEHEPAKALEYAKKADSITNTNNIGGLKVYTLAAKGDVYEKLGETDSAILYDTRALKLSQQANDDEMISNGLLNLANAFAKTTDTASAFKNYRAALPYLARQHDENSVCEATLGLAGLFERAGKPDSAEYYGKLSATLARQYGFENRLLSAANFLTAHYKKRNNVAAAFSYLQAAAEAKDSIYGSEKVRRVQQVSLNEQLRQNELNAERVLEGKERMEKLQMLAIGILIPGFFLLSVFLTKQKVHKGVVKFSGVISLLMFFEYLTLLIHPFVAEKTDHSPALEIIIFVAIAAVITPTHHRIEHWLLEKLTYLHTLHHKVVQIVAENAENEATPPDVAVPAEQ